MKTTTFAVAAVLAIASVSARKGREHVEDLQNSEEAKPNV